MNASIDDSPSAIGPQSPLDVLPSLAEPLPRELNNLIAQLIAFETRKRGSNARPLDVLQSVMAQMARHPRSTGSSIERRPSQMVQT
jgi:hypothetical protein